MNSQMMEIVIVSRGTIRASRLLGIEMNWARKVCGLINAEHLICPVIDDCNYFRNICRLVCAGYVLKIDGFDDEGGGHGAGYHVDDYIDIDEQWKLNYYFNLIISKSLIIYV